ncbi:mitotic spindle checkpoint protein MAD1 isoform X2 [Actinidia eriantha]|uniref:mitotic spindle checkpoint protein MAD1 isoform X2 n=1 Tax=Actinidia eriantha TaxID=165200 RepID=UPI002590DD08|nr:mitotic spindle checkpoint protein MAD1 isoform X2 [Actinidia eriantha]
MILRTPPPKKRRAPESPNSGRQLVIYEDSPAPESSHEHSEQMLCTYQCRQMVKSEFFEALSSAEKQAHDYQSKFEALNDNFSKAETERKKLRDQFFRAEQELAATKGREQALQEQLLKEVNVSQERISKQIKAYSELEVKFQSEINLRKKAESLAALAEEKASLLEGKLSHLSATIEREKNRLREDLVQMESQSKLSVSRISLDLERMECRANNAEKELVLLKQQFEDLKKRLNESLHQKNELEKKLSSFTFQEIPSTQSDMLVKHLREELRTYESEVQEARKLKSSHESIELLKEKLLEEKRRRERAESDLLKLSEIELSMRKVEDELSAWKMLVRDIPGVSHAEDIPLTLAALQKEVIESMVKVGEANARLKQIEVSLDAAELGKQNAEAEAALATENAEVLKSEVKRIEVMLSSVTDERNQLKYVVDELNKQKNIEAGGDSVYGTLLQELEARLAQKECCVKELESNLSEQRAITTRQHNEIKLLTERLNNEAKRIKSLEREGDHLRSEISLLESKVGHGDFSSENTKVLRMVNTLAVEHEAKQTIEALQSELQKTKEKLQAVEELKKQSADAGTLVDSYISGKIVQYKEQIATLEKREERYKTVFADRISVFRRACCELFGYKIVMDDHQRSDGIPVTRFTLQSIYAQNDDEKLQFEYESGNTNILANDYTSQPEISRQVDTFIRKMNSIPAFTANLTLESFQKRTIS